MNLLETVALFEPLKEALENFLSNIDAVLKSVSESDLPTPEQEMEQAKRIIDKHMDSGWLLGYHHENGDGFSYRFRNYREEAA